MKFKEFKKDRILFHLQQHKKGDCINNMAKKFKYSIVTIRPLLNELITEDKIYIELSVLKKVYFIKK